MSEEQSELKIGHYASHPNVSPSSGVPLDPPVKFSAWIDSPPTYNQGYVDGVSEGYSRGWRECWEHLKSLE